MKGLVLRKRTGQVPPGRSLDTAPLVDATLQAQDCAFLCTGMTNDLWADLTNRDHWRLPRETPFLFFFFFKSVSKSPPNNLA